MVNRVPRASKFPSLPKCPTGIRGLDQITGGGVPRGRPTLVCGGAGTGKTLLAMEFLVRGAVEHGDPGVFVAFEERPEDLVQNTGSLGFDVGGLVARKKLHIEQIAVDRNTTFETGDYNLDGLFMRLGLAIDAVRAKRVVLDTIEVLFGALTDTGILRSEIHRLFAWLKSKGVTTVVTAERGDGTFTRHGLEEYVSDCVILLDQRVNDQIATRRMRILKYRGALHGTNEYPFLIDQHGFVVLPITAVALDYAAGQDIVSTGIAKLDSMLGSGGMFRGSTLMVSGAAGTGKSSIAAHFVDSACRRGERCTYFALEESPAQIVRNMRSIGIDLEPWIKRGLLSVHAARPATFGLEVHISTMLSHIDEFGPKVVVVDPVSSLETAGTSIDARNMMQRLVDQLKARQITALFTSLTAPGDAVDQSEVGVSSIVDTWFLVRNLEQNGERTRGLYILKSRGMNHSNQIRELVLTDHGIDLEEISVGPEGVLVGSARLAQQKRDLAVAMSSRQEIERAELLLARKRKELAARLAEIETAYAGEILDIERSIAQEQNRQTALVAGRIALATERGSADSTRRKRGRGEQR